MLYIHTYLSVICVNVLTFSLVVNLQIWQALEQLHKEWQMCAKNYENSFLTRYNGLCRFNNIILKFLSMKV